MVEVVRWLIETNHLTEDKCPIPVKDGSRSYSVAASPTLPVGKPMYKPEKVGALYLNVHGSAAYVLKKAQFIISTIGKRPDEFKVRFPD